MVNTIKTLLKHWVFAEEQSQWDARFAALERRQEKLDVKDVVRQRLQSYRPGKFKENSSLTAFKGVEGEENEFLARAHEVYDSKVLEHLADFVTARLTEHMARYANSTEELNFNRASINGAELIAEELNLLETEYQNRRLGEEDYDKFKVT